MRIRKRLFTLIRTRIRILLLIKVMRMCHLRSTEPRWQNFEPLLLNCKRPPPFKPPRLRSEPPQLLNFDSDMDPDQAFHSGADPDYQNQCFGSVTFRYGSGCGSPDPYLWLTDPDAMRIRTKIFDFWDALKINFFLFFNVLIMKLKSFRIVKIGMFDD